MSLGILLVHEMGIVRTDELDAILTGQLNKYLVGLLLQGEGLTVGAYRGIFHLMALQFQIVVVAKDVVIPFYGLAGTCHVAIQYFLGDLAGYAGRTDYQAFMVSLQVFPISSGTHIIAIDP